MPFVHLANGDVVHHSQEELDDLYGAETPTAYRKDGKESGIIGIYADDVEYEDENAEDENPRHDSVETDTQNTPPNDNVTAYEQDERTHQ